MNGKVIGERLTKLRGKRTQKEISDAIGVCQSTYSMYESGERIPSDEVKKRISKYYRRSVQFIFYSK